jgi:hypothetical protein
VTQSTSLKGSKDVKIEAGTSVDIKAGSAATLKAGTTCDVSAGAKLTCKGSVSDFLADGINTIKGATVMIN